MKRMIMLVVILCVLIVPAYGMELEAPEAPDSVTELVPEAADSFGEGLWNVIKASMQVLNPSLAEALRVSFRVLASVMLCGIIREVCPSACANTVNLACTAACGAALLAPAASLIRLGVETAAEISEYGKLLLPIMTGAMAAQGGLTASTALYAGTALFDSVLISLINRLMVPMLYLYLGLAVANGAFPEHILKRLQELINWLMTWVLKIGLYLFTGYLSITGVISGSADAAALKAAKTTISTAIPVVGGILSDASDTVLASIGVLKSAAGIYGLLTFAALFLAPFLQIAVQYLLLKGTAALCESIDGQGAAGLISDFAGAMGLVLAMVGTETILMLVSTVCLMKGVS